MKVEQKELNVFLVTLDAAEIDKVQDKSAEFNIPVADIMLDILTCGFPDYFED